MNETRYLTQSDVIAIHERMMQQLRLPPNPLRPDGTLESALNRPQMAAWYEEADIVRQAALLGTGISQAQAFLDGNFLQLNGFNYVGDRLELAQQFEAFALQSRDAQALDNFELWLRMRVSSQ